MSNENAVRAGLHLGLCTADSSKVGPACRAFKILLCVRKGGEDHVDDGRVQEHEDIKKGVSSR
jgi:hypothetical protein